MARARWKIFLLQPKAVLSLTVLGCLFLISIFAYTLSPDKSPNANTMTLELSAKSPGFSTSVLLLPKKVKSDSSGFWNRFWHGTPSNYTEMPINGYWKNNNKLVVRHYIDEGLEDTISVPIKELQFREPIQANIIKRMYWLGTDRYGRDILSRLLIGSRVSLSVGFIAVFLSITIGIFLGSIAGYFGGWVDALVLWLINILWSIPTLLLVFAITITIGKGFWELFIAIGLTMWVGTARLVRGQVMSIKNLDYITSAKLMGIPSYNIIIKHILPNIVGPLMVVASSNFAAAMLTEAGLSFLGIGIQPPQPSWGLMIKEHYNFLMTDRPFLAIIPGLALVLVVYSIHILGNVLRDYFDVKSEH